MTVPVDELMRVVRGAVQPYTGHREYEDIYSEALVHAWQQVARQEWQTWTVIAWKAAQWQAAEYLRVRRSGRLNGRHCGEAVFPIFFADFANEPEIDGGMAAADARLQLWLWGLAIPPPETLTCAHCGQPVPAKTGGRRRTYCGSRCKWKRLEAVRKKKREATR